MNNKAAVIVVLLCCFAVPLTISDDSDAADLPSYDMKVNVLTKTYFTNSLADTFWLSDCGADDAAAYAEIIAGANMQGKLSVDRSGAPSWITYELFPYRYDVRFTVTPGAVCDETFWIMFGCFGENILLIFDLKVEDSGSGVISDDNYNTFTLHFDGNGGSSKTVSAQSVSGRYVFDLGEYTPTRAGYDFLGWSDSKDGTSVLISNSLTMQIASGRNVDSTVYAVWQETDEHITIFTVWDDIRTFFSEPLACLALFGSMTLLALFIRSRRVAL